MSGPPSNDERLRRWRLILGGDSADGTGIALGDDDLAMDGALSLLYDADKSGRVGMSKSAPKVARWLGDIRKFFPTSVVQMLQKDALERLDLRQMLKQPELLRAVQPDVHLVANLLSLRSVLPPEARETARSVVRTVVDQLERRLAEPMRQAVSGSLDRSSRSRRPRHHEIDWNRTIRANLRHYQAEYRTIIPETRIGFGRRRRAMREVILCIDQSGSMATSVVYAGIFGAVLASLPALKTHVVVYDTAVVDLTAELHDPVDLLFGTQLGGGNDTPRALTYCAGLITRPAETILILISDLYEGSGSEEMLKLLGGLVASGVQAIGLLALNDEGAPSYDHANAQSMADLGIPVFACTPDLFPDLMGAALSRSDLGLWAASHDISTTRGRARGV
ncbi:VWA domain-containing protein [Isosphaeraceae bacterium EP7]